MRDTPPAHDTRAAQAEIVVDAAPEAVWRALTDAVELANWFPLEARVTPGVGGRIWVSWGESFAGEAKIEIWEPGRHIRQVESRVDAEGKPVQVAVDWIIETRGASTVVRVVHSGFGKGAEFDAEYDGVSRGWKYELRSLRHYLERHRGVQRRVAWAQVPSSASLDRIHDALFSPAGLAVEGHVDGLREGDPYRLVASTGDVFEGTVLVNRPPTDFAGTVRGMNDGILRFVQEVGYVWIWLATYGVPEAEVSAFARRWQELLERLVRASEA
jgi:uncharacterized protein YndB with AHSA1/START domain